NGDGRDDIVGFGFDAVFVSLANSDGTFNPIGVGLDNNFTKNDGGWITQNDYPRLLGDINGDGRDDIVGFGFDAVFVSLANSDGTFNPIGVGLDNNFTKNDGGWITQNDYPRQLADVNGDGLADIVGFGLDAVYVSLAKGDGTFNPIGVGLDNNFTKNDGGWITQNDYPRQLADVNGDGSADIVGFGLDAVYVSLANGDGTFAPIAVGLDNSFTKNDGGWITQNDYPRQLADVNGDGLADIVGFGFDNVFVSFANGDGTFSNATVGVANNFAKNGGGWVSQDDYPRQLGDINGDGRADIVGFGLDNVYVSLGTTNKNDSIVGGDGNDTIDGLTGNDTLRGAAGDDKLYGRSGNDFLDGDSGNDYLAGSIGDDTLDGDTGNDTMYGEAGNDKLYGWVGSDYMSGGSGNDLLHGQGESDTLYGGGGNDTIYAGGDNVADYLDGDSGNDLLYAGPGNDTLYGDAGNDTLNGEQGADIMYGGIGDDIYYVDENSDEFFYDRVYEKANEGIDTIVSSESYFIDYSVSVENLILTGTAFFGYGNDLNNAIAGNSSNNYLWGNSGSDSLSGGAGKDTLNGYGYSFSDEFDTLTGGANADTFVLGNYFDSFYRQGGYTADGYAIITDFNRVEGDKLQVHGISSDYILNKTANVSGSIALDTQILYKGNLIAIAQDTTNVFLPADFIFA
ncbi:MAG TPA: hypothetical protein DCY88_19245, partial [Cyanobacteria bacterium UBA11372]|nr:hypothetical protein [Cyanobacteria bacterium UBA11372]